MDEISKPKYILFLIMIGLGIGILNFFINQVLEALSVSLPIGMFGGATAGAGLVLAIFLTNRSIRRGGCNWLKKAQ